MIVAIVILGIHTLFFGGIVFFGGELARVKGRKKENLISLDQVTVLVPFRNEEKRIGKLLSSIRNSKRLPQQIIFIDDHSKDESAKQTAELAAEMFDRIQYIKLPDEQRGKKRAIRYGIQQVATDYVLTMDADVYFSLKYFDRIASLRKCDMAVFPALMRPESVKENFFEIDLLLGNAVNTGLFGWKRPIVASGANLLFRKDKFELWDDYESHKQVASGDDTYLLRDFNRNGADVLLKFQPKYAVSTKTPKSFKEFIDQRLRWLGKTKNVGDQLATFVAGTQFALTLIYWIAFVWIFILDWRDGLTFWAVKTLIDQVVFLPFFFTQRKIASWLLLPYYQLFFPIYSLILLILLPIRQPEWKGRATSHN